MSSLLNRGRSTQDRGRGRSPSSHIHRSPNRKLRSTSPYRISTLTHLENELDSLELIHRKEIEQWLIKHYKPTDKEIDDRMRAIDMEEEYDIYPDGFSDRDSTWHKKRKLKQMIAEERAKAKKGGRQNKNKTRRQYA
jgi:hypothetical protein